MLLDFCPAAKLPVCVCSMLAALLRRCLQADSCVALAVSRCIWPLGALWLQAQHAGHTMQVTQCVLTQVHVKCYEVPSSRLICSVINLLVHVHDKARLL